MTIDLDDRARLLAFRRSVLGFLAGSALGGLFVAAVVFLDIGHIASLSAATETGLSLGRLGLMPVSFGLLGLFTGPALGSVPGEASG